MAQQPKYLRELLDDEKLNFGVVQFRIALSLVQRFNHFEEEVSNRGMEDETLVTLSGGTARAIIITNGPRCLTAIVFPIRIDIKNIVGCFLSELRRENKGTPVMGGCPTLFPLRSTIERVRHAAAGAEMNWLLLNNMRQCIMRERK